MLDNTLAFFGKLPPALKGVALATGLLLAVFLFGLFLTVHFATNHEDPAIEGRNFFDTLYKITLLGAQGLVAVALFYLPGTVIVLILGWEWEIIPGVGLLPGLIFFALIYFFFSEHFDNRNRF